MRLEINGQPREAPDGASIADLLRELGLDRQACAVEVNAELVPKRLHAERPLAPGDRVEIVTLVGGG